MTPLSKASYQPGDTVDMRWDIIANSDVANYNSRYIQKPLNRAAMRELIYFNAFYMQPQPVSVARQIHSLWYDDTMGRPMGSYMTGPLVVNTPQAIPSRYPDPYLRSGAPDSIVAYVKSVTAQIISNRLPRL